MSQTIERTHSIENIYIVLRPQDTLVADGIRYAVVRSGGSFHLRRTKKHWTETNEDLFAVHAFKAHGILYRPLHPSMTPEDIEGATYAFDNGVSYEFAHCSPQEQVDYAALARTFAIQQFFLAITRVQSKIAMATNATTRAALVGKFDALRDFAKAVGEEVYDTVLGETLGHWHRNPHHDHRRDLTVDAIASVLAVWKKAGLTNEAAAARRLNVTADAGKVTTALTETHTVESRHARVARLAAEAKKKEAATPADGDGA